MNDIFRVEVEIVIYFIFICVYIDCSFDLVLIR